jgi:hypothetical protein
LIEQETKIDDLIGSKNIVLAARHQCHAYPQCNNEIARSRTLSGSDKSVKLLLERSQLLPQAIEINKAIDRP